MWFNLCKNLDLPSIIITLLSFHPSFLSRCALLNFKSSNIWEIFWGCYSTISSYFSSLALYLYEFRGLACKMHRQLPSSFWLMFQRMEHHTALQPNKDNSMKSCMTINICQLTSLAWVISTAQDCKSHLLPTSTIGTSSASFTRFICSRYVPKSWILHVSECLNVKYHAHLPISSKLLALFTANTNRNPSPVRIY